MQGTRSSRVEDDVNKNGDDDNDDDDGGEEVVQRFLCAKVDLPCVHWQ